MTSLFRYDSKLLVRDGKLAIHERCCCVGWACVRIDHYGRESEEETCPTTADDTYYVSSTCGCYQCVDGNVNTGYEGTGPGLHPPLACTVSASVETECQQGAPPGTAEIWVLTVVSTHATEALCNAACDPFCDGPWV